MSGFGTGFATTPERVWRVALVSSLASPAGVTPRRQGAPASQLRPRMLKHAGDGGGRRPPPGFMLREMERASPPSDRRILTRPDVRELLLAAGEEAFRDGTQAVVDEGRLTAGTWGFRPADVVVEVLLWHGEQDVTVPVEAARALAAALPRCNAVFLPGAGPPRRSLPRGAAAAQPRCTARAERERPSACPLMTAARRHGCVPYRRLGAIGQIGMTRPGEEEQTHPVEASGRRSDGRAL